MNNKTTLLALALVSTLFLSYAATASSFHNKILKIEGKSSLYGHYQGELEIRTVDRKILATKVFTYQDYQFENLIVQEVWTGEATESDNQLIITYKIKQADIFKSAEGYTRNPEMFKNDILIEQRINNKHQDSFSRGSERLQERIIGSSDLSAGPLWKNQRTSTISYGKESSLLIKVAAGLIDLKVFKWYHAAPEVKAYGHRKEFKSKNQYFVFDPTDYDFYQKNPTILRVVNKVPDTISLVEDIQRRNAYAPSLSDKMKHFEHQMKNYHINELGQYSTAQFDKDGRFIGYIMVGDGTLWTGMYLASQAMRYQATQEKEALENVKKSLKGLMLLMDITGDPKVFARNAAYDDGSIPLGEDYRLGAGIHNDKVWRVKGNNDMFKGLIHGFIWSYIVLPDSERELRNELLKHMKGISKLSVAEEKLNKIPAYGLRALATNSKQDKKDFVKNFKLTNMGRKLINIEGSTYLGGIADWSGINLSMVSTITNILIAKNLKEKEIYHESMRSLMLQWKDMADARRDLLTMAAYQFALKEGFDLDDADEINDGLSKKDLKKLWKKTLNKSIWSLREIPIHRSRYDISYDYSLKPDWSLSWWPKLPWKSVKEKQAIEYHMQGAYAYPFFESKGIGSNFVWKDQPFNYKGSSEKFRKDPGADFLYTYWVARLAGLVQ